MLKLFPYLDLKCLLINSPVFTQTSKISSTQASKIPDSNVDYLQFSACSHRVTRGSERSLN